VTVSAEDERDISVVDPEKRELQDKGSAEDGPSSDPNDNPFQLRDVGSDFNKS
jgi:hypothetical protein